MLGGIGKGLFLRLASYAVFILGFFLLFQAFENSNILVGIAGGVAVLVAMWLMVGFRSPSWLSKPGDSARHSDREPRDDSNNRDQR